MDPVAAFCHTNGTNIKWYVNYIPVSSNDRMTISPDGKTLVILRVSRHDKELHCSIESIPEIVQRSDVIFLDVACESSGVWESSRVGSGLSQDVTLGRQNVRGSIVSLPAASSVWVRIPGF